MVDVPEHRRGRVVGARGATIKRIERDSGARLQLPRATTGRVAPARGRGRRERLPRRRGRRGGRGRRPARRALPARRRGGLRDARPPTSAPALFEGDGGFACRAVPNPGGVVPADVVATVLDNRAFAAGDGAALAALADGDRVWVFGWARASRRRRRGRPPRAPELAAAIADAIAAAPNGDVAAPPPPPPDDAAAGRAPPPDDAAPRRPTLALGRGVRADLDEPAVAELRLDAGARGLLVAEPRVVDGVHALEVAVQVLEVKGIRANKREPGAFILQAIAECKQELRNVDPYVKAQAVRKLTYLQMMGYDVSWASFAIVETMSQARFAHKRIGYLAACQCFSESTDVVLLTTNLLKKEFQSTSQYEVGLAVNCLANIVTKDLARDLLQDSVLLMSHSKPYVRKKAVSSMFKLFVKYPQGLRLTFEKLKERLADGERP
ncbi:hypothetical protein JL721_10081 [Aureococcus anophagefferens]|nr:hypothetical protein JL721_10081 [Aureococcus anophagefferens]